MGLRLVAAPGDLQRAARRGPESSMSPARLSVANLTPVLGNRPAGRRRVEVRLAQRGVEHARRPDFVLRRVGRTPVEGERDAEVAVEVDDRAALQRRARRRQRRVDAIVRATIAVRSTIERLIRSRVVAAATTVGAGIRRSAGVTCGEQHERDDESHARRRIAKRRSRER